MTGVSKRTRNHLIMSVAIFLAVGSGMVATLHVCFVT